MMRRRSVGWVSIAVAMSERSLIMGERSLIVKSQLPPHGTLVDLAAR
jgi:hypothetical protein